MAGSASTELAPGSSFGVYRVGECIGTGGMARVYRARHSVLERTVALKVMSSAAMASEAGHHRFLREARAAAAIKHPHVVELIDVGVRDGVPYLVMEFLEGQDLESYLAKTGPLSDRQLADLALPIIAAIGAVHDAGVVHRDIKPSNIFLARETEEDVVPKVLDFGISKAFQRPGEGFKATGPMELIGTPLYMPPEAVNGARDLTPRSDQYSLGLVLYECAAGRPAFDSGETLTSLMRKIAEGSIQPLGQLKPGVSPELARTIARATSRNPEHRFGHVREVGKALWGLASERTRHVWFRRFGDGRATNDSPLRSDPSLTMASTSSRPGRKRAPFLASAAIAAVAVSWWLSSDSTEFLSDPTGSIGERPLGARGSDSSSLGLRPGPPVRAGVAEVARPRNDAPAETRVAPQGPEPATPPQAPPTSIAKRPERAARPGAGRAPSARPVVSNPVRRGAERRVNARATSPSRAARRRSPVVARSAAVASEPGDELEGMFVVDEDERRRRSDGELEGLFLPSSRDDPRATARRRSPRDGSPPNEGVNDSPILD